LYKIEGGNKETNNDIEEGEGRSEGKDDDRDSGRDGRIEKKEEEIQIVMQFWRKKRR